jgi:hypothetical protein
MPITFVSAFIDLKEERDPRHTPLSRFHFFEELASTGINIHLYLSYAYRGYYETIVKSRPNVFVDYIELADLFTYKDLAGLQYGLPSTDNPSKDTAHYHILNSAKIEFVARAILQNVFPSDKYAWIDFSVGHVFRNSKETLKYLQDVATEPVEGLHFPGCWPTHYGRDELFSRISWRFCGGFFVGDCGSLLKFHELYRAKFRGIVEKSGILPWEVNVWHYLEIHEGFSPTWYAADHNDSIVRFKQ